MKKPDEIKKRLLPPEDEDTDQGDKLLPPKEAQAAIDAARKRIKLVNKPEKFNLARFEEEVQGALNAISNLDPKLKKTLVDKYFPLLGENVNDVIEERFYDLDLVRDSERMAIVLEQIDPRQLQHLRGHAKRIREQRNKMVRRIQDLNFRFYLSNELSLIDMRKMAQEMVKAFPTSEEPNSENMKIRKQQLLSFGEINDAMTKLTNELAMQGDPTLIKEIFEELVEKLMRDQASLIGKATLNDLTPNPDFNNRRLVDLYPENPAHRLYNRCFMIATILKAANQMAALEYYLTNRA